MLKLKNFLLPVRCLPIIYIGVFCIQVSIQVFHSLTLLLTLLFVIFLFFLISSSMQSILLLDLAKEKFNPDC